MDDTNIWQGKNRRWTKQALYMNSMNKNESQTHQGGLKEPWTVFSFEIKESLIVLA
jgi:hypothetical protein